MSVDISNLTLRFIATTYEPFVYPCAVAEVIDYETCPMPGIDIEIFFYVLHMLNITNYEGVYYTERGDWGQYLGDGKFTGYLKDIHNGDVDTINTWYRMTETRHRYFDYSYPLMYTRLKLGYIMQKPSTSINMDSTKTLYSVFDRYVWYCLIGLMFIIIILMLLAPNVRRWKEGVKAKSVTDFQYHGLWQTLCLVLDQYYDEMSTQTLFGNITLVCIGFLYLFTVTFYEGMLVSRMMRSDVTVPFKSISELAALVKDGTYTLVRDESGAGNTFWWDDVSKASFAGYAAMKEAIDQNPVKLVPTVADVIDAIEGDPTLVYPGQDLPNSLGTLVGRCTLTFQVDAEAASSNPSSFIFKKGSPWPDIMAPIIAGMSSTIHNLEDRYLRSALEVAQRACPQKESTEGDPLSINHFFGIFIPVMILIGAALVAFICELLAALLLKRKNKDF